MKNYSPDSLKQYPKDKISETQGDLKGVLAPKGEHTVPHTSILWSGFLAGRPLSKKCFYDGDLWLTILYLHNHSPVPKIPLEGQQYKRSESSHSSGSHISVSTETLGSNPSILMEKNGKSILKNGSQNT